jgi:putative ABC transport system permease protein
VLRQKDYYEEQSTAVTKLITTLGYLVAALMATGAICAALNTMYSSVAARSREIATLRALGFGAGAVVVSVMLESLLIAIVGGVVGAGIAYVAFNDLKTATMNWQSFSQITFAFDVTAGLILGGIIWATLIGFVGGLLPAIRAARLPIVSALREL